MQEGDYVKYIGEYFDYVLDRNKIYQIDMKFENFIKLKGQYNFLPEFIFEKECTGYRKEKIIKLKERINGSTL